MSNFRDVSPVKLVDDLKADLLFILDFLKNPIQRVSHFPNWSWKRTVLLNVGISVVSGSLRGLIPPNIYHILFGVFFLPIITFLMTHILAGFFFYYFQVFEKRTVDFLNLLKIVFLANIPFLIVHTLTSLLPPITFLGLAFAALILIVGLTESFQLEKKRTIKLVTLLYLMVFLVWLWDALVTSRLGRSVSNPIETVDS
jgi:hypothetical protein